MTSVSQTQRRRGSKKFEVQKVAIFQQTADIIGAYSFNFAPKFPQNGGFLAPNFVFLDENFPTRRKFSNRLKFKGGSHPSHDATGQTSTLQAPVSLLRLFPHCCNVNLLKIFTRKWLGTTADY